MTKMLLVLHVVGSVFIIGPMAILPMSAMRALRSGGASQLVTLAKSTELFSMLSIIVALIGFPLMWRDHHGLSLTTPWILGSVVLYVVALLLNLFLVVPAMRRAAEEPNVSSSSPTAAPGGPTPGYAAISAGSGVVSLLLVAVVVLMVWRP